VDESLSFTANLKQAITELDWLSYTYQATNIVIATQRFTLIPLDFFEDEQVENIFYYNIQRLDNETVNYNILQKSNTVILYSIDKAFLSLLNDQFPTASIQVQTSPLIEYLSTQNRQARNRQMLCFITEENITITAMERRNLLDCNIFSCNCMADRLYYILHIWKQLGFDQQKDELLLADATADPELKSELARFIQQVTEVPNAAYLDLVSINI